MDQDRYAEELGVLVEAVDGERSRVRVPFRDGNSNPGGALHGGVAASVIDVAAALVGRAGAEERPGVEHAVVDLSVAYLAAAINEDVVGEARVLRRGKELCFVEVDVRTDGGKATARGLVTHRSGGGGGTDRHLLRDPDGGLAPSDALPGFVRFFTAAPFMARLGIRGLRAEDGSAVAALPWNEGHTDAAGALHGGAVAALIDTTGAMASWSLVPLDPRNKASTPALHVTHHSPARDEEVVAEAITLRRADELFTNQVTVRGAGSGRLIATGTVLYRIVVAG
jgi:uncharacterized protein (TIGR00369 family)